MEAGDILTITSKLGMVSIIPFNAPSPGHTSKPSFHYEGRYLVFHFPCLQVLDWSLCKHCHHLCNTSIADPADNHGNINNYQELTQMAGASDHTHTFAHKEIIGFQRYVSLSTQTTNTYVHIVPISFLSKYHPHNTPTPTHHILLPLRM